MKILYNFPSRERPYKFFNALDNIISMAKHGDYIILATLDIDDPSMTTAAVRDKIATYDKVKPSWGFSGCKTAAINRSIWLVDDWDVCITWSDDFWILKEGFDLDVLSHYDDGFSGIVHYNDGHVNERLVTLPIMDRTYYKIFNFIYNPIFLSVYSDNWQMDVCKLLGKYKYIGGNWVLHKHSIWGYGEADALLKRTENPTIYAADGEKYREQKALNYELHKYRL